MLNRLFRGTCKTRHAQAKPLAPPLQVHCLPWWGRRFGLPRQFAAEFWKYLFGIVLLVWGTAAALGQCLNSPPISVFPHLVDGSGWKSSLYLVNESASEPVNYALTFRGDTAQPVLLSFTDGRKDNQVSGTIAAGGLAILDTPGLDSDPLVVATATLTAAGTLSGFSVIREKQAGQPDREATIPLAKAVARGLIFPFDNTGNFQSSIALTVLCGPNSAVVLTAIATDETGAQLGRSELKITRGGHMAFMAADQISGTKGKRGLIRIGIPGPQGAGVQLAGLGLRFTPSGALTSFPPSPWTFPPARPAAHPARSRTKK